MKVYFYFHTVHPLKFRCAVFVLCCTIFAKTDLYCAVCPNSLDSRTVSNGIVSTNSY